MAMQFPVIFSLFVQAMGHAKLTSPEPRGGPVAGTGAKLTPFANARTVANGLDGGDGCGGALNNDPGAQTPRITYSPGQQVTVQWSVTIPHNADRLNTGVRIALRYSSTDGFANNVLAGGVEGDPTYAAVDAGSTSTEQMTITLPSGKTCSQCTLQWMWAARADGGFYLGCADIAIAQAQVGTQTTLTTTTQPGLGAGVYQPPSPTPLGVVGGSRPLCLRVSCTVTLVAAFLMLLKS
jgi:hypothetical protein